VVIELSSYFRVCPKGCHGMVVLSRDREVFWFISKDLGYQLIELLSSTDLISREEAEVIDSQIRSSDLQAQLCIEDAVLALVNLAAVEALQGGGMKSVAPFDCNSGERAKKAHLN